MLSKHEPEDDLDEEESGDEEVGKSEKRAGRRKIKIEYIEDKSRRHITFSKRKAGIMKKAYELSTLTGTQVLLLVVSETGLVYTFTTPKLQPLVTKPEGKNLIQACLNAPDPPSAQEPSTPSRATHNPPTYSNDSTPTVDGNNDTVYDSVDRKSNSNNQIPSASSSQPYAIGLNPYGTGQYGGVPSNMTMNSSSGIPTTTPSYISPSQYSQYAQKNFYNNQSTTDNKY
jgi:MADS-box transcription factor